MRRTDSLENSLMLWKTEGRRKGWQRMGWQRMASPTWWPWVWASSESWWWTGKSGMLQSMASQSHGVTKSQTRLSNWTEPNWTFCESHLETTVTQFENHRHLWSIKHLQHCLLSLLMIWFPKGHIKIGYELKQSCILDWVLLPASYDTWENY